MKKLIFFDIDGTLITDGPGEHLIPGSLPRTLNALQENGHLCFINTGRALAEIDSVIRSLPFNGYVCGCGTYIAYRGKTLYSYTIPFPTGNEILNSLKECHLEWLLEGTNHVYYSSKASGIAFLENYFGIPNDDTISIGDSTNDLPMLEYTGYSIAMGNSSSELFEVADYVTGSVMEDGVYHAMKHLKLI